MELTISAGADPTVWPFIVGAAILGCISMYPLYSAFYERDASQVYLLRGGSDDAANAAAAARRARRYLLIFVSLALIFAVTLTGAIKVGAAENHDQYDEITTALYENFDVANLTVGSTLDGSLPNKLVCDEGDQSAKDRSYATAEWVAADGTVVKGTLVNMGNVDGECRYILSTNPTQG